MDNQAGNGVKFDGGKARFDLIPAEELYELAELFALGASKYEDNNWAKGMRWGQLFAAMMRHAWKWWMGEDNDQEDGQNHLTSVMWCAMALRAHQRRGIGVNDRGGSMNAKYVHISPTVDSVADRSINYEINRRKENIDWNATCVENTMEFAKAAVAKRVAQRDSNGIPPSI